MARRWTAGSVVRRAAEVLRADGTRTLCFKLLGETVYRRVRLVELPLVPPPPVRAGPPGLRFGFLEPGAIDSYLRLRPDLSRTDVERRLARGDRCWLALLDGEVVSGRWIAEGAGWVEYLERELTLRPRDVYVYETYTAPEHRGLAVSAAAGTRLAALLAEEGYERLVGAVVPENRPASSTFRKTGYRETGTMGYVGTRRRRRYFAR